MFSKVFAAAALAVVSAADVPLFSSNDDYDEINLNIRMLANHTATTTHTVAAKARVTATFPTGTTAATLNSNTGFKNAFCTTVKAVPGIDSSAICSVSSVTDAARRARQLTVSLTLEIAYSLVFSSAAAMTAAQAKINDTSAGSDFATAMNANLANNVIAAGGPQMSGVSATSSGVTTPPAGGAAAPSPSPSSNAAKLAVSGLGAFAAFMATML